MTNQAKQSVQSIVETIRNYPAENVDSIIMTSQRADNAIATLASVLTTGCYDNKQSVPALRFAVHNYLSLLQAQLFEIIESAGGLDKVTDKFKNEIAARTARLAHLQKAVNRALSQAAKKRNLPKSEYLVLKHSKLANDKRHLLASKKITVTAKGEPEAPAEKPQADSPENTAQGPVSVAGEIKTEQQEKELSFARRLAAVSEVITEAAQLGDQQTLANIAAQALTALEDIQKAKPTKQSKENKASFTRSFKLLKGYRAHSPAVH